MTTCKYHFIKVFSFLLILVLAFNAGYAQNTNNKRGNDKGTAIRDMVAAKNFVFKARQAQPTGGRTVQLTSEYDLRITADTVQAVLPYFGRAFSAPVGANDGGIRFTSTRFDYKQTDLKKRKRGWNITIQPKDTRDVQQLVLYIFENGTASLQVISTNRQPISFNGSITEKG